MTLPTGATISQSELDKVQAALDALAKDPHAPRSLSLNVTINIHNDYPKMLYKGQGAEKSVSVADSSAEEAARADGFGDYEHPVPAEE